MDTHDVEKLQVPLDAEERRLMDPENWDWENPVEGIPLPSKGPILEIRLTRDEMVSLERAARAQGMTMHEFVKQAALDRIPQNVPG